MRIITLLSFLLVFTYKSIGQTSVLKFSDLPVIENAATLDNAWAGGMNSMQFSTIDLNYDGLDDLFCFDKTCNKIMTYLNVGTPGNYIFEYAPQYEGAFPSNIQEWVLLVDYNGDGKKDIFGFHPGGIKCFRNTGNITTGPQFVSAEGLSIYGLINSYQHPNDANITVTGVDIPAILDVDNDGDIDILTFGQYGSQIEYHKNMSMENYGIPDSLKYIRKNRCWGKFIESASTNDVYLDSCNPWIVNDSFPEFDPGQFLDESEDELRGNRHSGSTILALDMTGDGVKEMLLGDVLFTNVVGLYNGGTIVNDDSPMISKDTAFPSYDIPVDLWLFPAMFYEDMDGDGARDLLISPNSYNQSEDISSVWLYENLGNDSVTDFNYVQDDFLQEDMIDVGIVSKPVFFDYDNDGLLDLFIGNLGAYNRTSNTYKSSISQYKNVGTSSAPEFELITHDYENLSSVGLSVGIHPAFADLDGDGDKDMIIGESDGKIHYFENIAPSSADADFVLNTPNYEDDNGTVIDVGYDAAPFLEDMDRDGDNDLIIGNKSGNLVYYENTGSAAIPSFTFVSNTWGDVDVQTPFDQYGYATPVVYDNSGTYELYIGCNRGTINYYTNVENNLSGTFTLVDSAQFNINTGIRSCPAFADINNDSIPDLINGNYRGGLGFFSSIDSVGIAVNEIEIENFTVYPNPATNEVFIRFDELSSPVNYTLFDISGKIIASGTLNNTTNSIDISSISNGYYAFRVSRDEGSSTVPLIVLKK